MSVLVLSLSFLSLITSPDGGENDPLKSAEACRLSIDSMIQDGDLVSESDEQVLSRLFSKIDRLNPASEHYRLQVINLIEQEVHDYLFQRNASLENLISYAESIVGSPRVHSDSTLALARWLAEYASQLEGGSPRRAFVIERLQSLLNLLFTGEPQSLADILAHFENQPKSYFSQNPVFVSNVFLMASQAVVSPYLSAEQSDDIYESLVRLRHGAFDEIWYQYHREAMAIEATLHFYSRKAGVLEGRVMQINSIDLNASATPTKSKGSGGRAIDFLQGWSEDLREAIQYRDEPALEEKLLEIDKRIITLRWFHQSIDDSSFLLDEAASDWAHAPTQGRLLAGRAQSDPDLTKKFQHLSFSLRDLSHRIKMRLRRLDELSESSKPKSREQIAKISAGIISLHQLSEELFKQLETIISETSDPFLLVAESELVHNYRNFIKELNFLTEKFRVISAERRITYDEVKLDEVQRGIRHRLKDPAFIRLSLLANPRLDVHAFAERRQRVENLESTFLDFSELTEEEIERLGQTLTIDDFNSVLDELHLSRPFASNGSFRSQFQNEIRGLLSDPSELDSAVKIVQEIQNEIDYSWSQLMNPNLRSPAHLRELRRVARLRELLQDLKSQLEAAELSLPIDLEAPPETRLALAAQSLFFASEYRGLIQGYRRLKEQGLDLSVVPTEQLEVFGNFYIAHQILARLENYLPDKPVE